MEWMDLAWMSDPQGWIALVTLVTLEIVLGIDNIVFISILAGRLPKAQQPLARRLGLAAALITRLGLLLSLAWMIRLTAPWFTVFSQEISGRDIILIAGGLFLLTKATMEIYENVELKEEQDKAVKTVSFMSVIIQIAILDIIFSLDSVITAVGMVDQVSIMVIAIVIAVIVMLFAVNPISEFIDRHLSVKMLALAFLLMVGMVLIADGLDMHVPKGYVYFAMAFSIFVEVINIRVRTSHQAAAGLNQTKKKD